MGFLVWFSVCSGLTGYHPGTAIGCSIGCEYLTLLHHGFYASFFFLASFRPRSLCFVARHYQASWDGVLLFLFLLRFFPAFSDIGLGLESGSEDDIRFQLGILVSYWPFCWYKRSPKKTYILHYST